MIDILDDHARWALGATAAERFSVLAAWRAIETAITEHGAPRQLIRDNGLQFISRHGLGSALEAVALEARANIGHVPQPE